MQFTINLTDESKLDLLLQTLREFTFIEILPISNGEMKEIKKKKKLSVSQMEFVKDIQVGLQEVELGADDQRDRRERTDEHDGADGGEERSERASDFAPDQPARSVRPAAIVLEHQLREHRA